MIGNGWRIAGMVLLGCALSACSPERPAPPPVVVAETSELWAMSEAPAPGRDPALRQIGKGEGDEALLERIQGRRETLPEEYRKRNNFAWARADVDGLEKKEYFAHSGIQDLSAISVEAAAPIGDISPKPAAEGAHFKTLCVNQSGAVEGADCWRRDVDTEYKILEDMASRLPDPSVSGHVLLFTELYPCPSCWNVMKQFLGVYTNVEMEVLYRIP